MKMPIAGIVLIALATSPSWAAQADPSSSVDHVVKNPQFETLPNAGQFLKYYPSQAQQQHVTGVVVIQCKVIADGKLDQCAVLQEEPLGYDFGEAALSLAKIFKLKPKTVEGDPVEGGIWKTRIRFQLATK